MATVFAPGNGKEHSFCARAPPFPLQIGLCQLGQKERQVFGDYSEILLRFVLSCFWGFPVSQAGSEFSLPYPSQSESAHHGLGSVKQSASHSKSILRVPGH